MKKHEDKLSLIPLGGLGEVGKNMLVIEYEGTIIVLDAGLIFPEEEMLGVDIVIPDMSYLAERRDKVKGVVLTHGHEDHVGALPYLLRQLDVPLFGTKLTLGIVQRKLEEFGVKMHRDTTVIEPGQPVEVGVFTVTPFRTNHSIPDSVGLAIETPVGLVVHSGDFKFDQTPVDGEVAGFHDLANLGRRDVLVLLSDSTGAEREGYTPSEKVVGQTLDQVIGSARRRVLVATFASNVHRVQQVFDAAARHRKAVTVVGRSMVDTYEIARRLGYLRVPEGLVVPVEEIDRHPADRTVILTTGSQGEPMSALTRIANNDHKWIDVMPGDTVVIAATPVPGNEKMVARTINNLFRRGAEVIYGPNSGVHVSGHASREELKLMLNLVQPRYFVPVHGEYRHLVHHAALAKELGIPSNHVFVVENGTILEFTRDGAQVAGRVQCGNVLVDGLGVGDVGNVVLRDRRQLSQDGILICVLGVDEDGRLAAGPELVSRGFVYVRESEALMEEARQRVADAFTSEEPYQPGDWGAIKSTVRDALSSFLYERTRRRPMILPIVIEV
ncbi:MAG: ribonuclease J [Bacillota bacterium]